jgi:hypothetical protein
MVFWHSLAHIHKGVLEEIRKVNSMFLWSGSKEAVKTPLVKWQDIAKPKDIGAVGFVLARVCTSSGQGEGSNCISSPTSFEPQVNFNNV